MIFCLQKDCIAQLKTGNLVTGQQYVALDFLPNAAPTRITYEGTYPVIPTLPTQIEEIASKVSQFITKLDKLPIEQIGKDLKDTIQGARQFANSPEIGEALRLTEHRRQGNPDADRRAKNRNNSGTQCRPETGSAVAGHIQGCSGGGFSPAVPHERNAGRALGHRALPAGAGGIPRKSPGIDRYRKRIGKMNPMRLFCKLGIVLCLIVFSGCLLKSQPAQYYTLNPMQRTEARPDLKSRFTVSVGPVILPDSLKRPQIAIRTNDNQVGFSEFHKWAGQLKDDVKRILAENLSILLAEEGATVVNR